MKYMFVKLRRDIVKMWVQFFAVFMMSVLAITIYSGMEGVWYGLKCETNTYYKTTKLANAWVNGSMISDDMVKDIKKLKDVRKVTKSMTATVQLGTDKKDNHIKCRAYKQSSKGRYRCKYCCGVVYVYSK